MTVRSVIIGLLVAVALASFGYVNDVWFFFSYIGGDLLPTHAFGLLVLGLLLVNPLLGWLGRWKFRSSEWTVMLSLAFMGSVIAGSALLWQYPHPWITPIHEQMDSPGWKDKDLLQYVPRIMMVDARPTLQDPNPKAVLDYMQGMGEGREQGLVPFLKVPWQVWAPTLSFWFTLLGLCFVGGICTTVIVHRQWSKREQLAYPIVTFANELIGGGPPEPGLDRPVSIFRKRAFWMGFALAAGILLVNGYYAWNKAFIQIPVGINCSSLNELSFFKALRKVPTRNFLDIKFYFAAVGLAYFLTSEAAFSMGISGWLYVLVAAPLIARGVNMKVEFLAGGLPAFMYFGAYLGMGVMVLYLGRRFYWSVIKRALFLPDKQGDALPREANALRIFVAVGVATVILLWQIGLHPLLGVGFFLLAMLLFLVIARINVSTGLFIIQPFWHPVTVMLGVFGTFALGPHALAVLALLCTAVTIDTRIAAVPLASNALKLGDDQKVKPGRLAGWMAVAVIVAMIVAVVFTVWLVYSYGVSGMRSGGTNWAVSVAKMPLEMIDQHVDKLDANYQLAEAKTGTRLGQAQPVEHFFTAAALGLGLVVACSWLRLRFPRWPLHPVMFLVWGTPWTVEYAPSFLLAWLLKGLIMKYGGQRMYVKARGFFVGLVAGELTAALFWAAIGVIYYAKTGDPGQQFLVRP